MKDLFFTTDLLALLRNDKYYGDPKNLVVALRKCGLSSAAHGNNIDQMYHELAVQIMDQGGESEPFLEGTFIYPEAITQTLKKQGLPSPVALQPEGTKNNNDLIDQTQLEQYFDTVCRNCGTVTDPLANSYRTPLGRLIFRTFMETRQTLGINATGRYVLEHLKNFDTGNIVTSVNEDSVTWLTDDSREKITSVQTIAKIVLNFNREIDNLL